MRDRRPRARPVKSALGRCILPVCVFFALFWLSRASSETETETIASGASLSKSSTATQKRDAGSCDVHAPTRLRQRERRERLFGWGRAQGALRLLRGDGIEIKLRNAGRSAGRGAVNRLDKYGFFVTDPVLSESEADITRAHLLDLLRSSKTYAEDKGCLGDLADCTERFDLSLRLTKTVTRAVNSIVSKLKPALVEIFDSEDAELVELSALITCAGSPEQRVHSDADSIGNGDRLISVFVSLQDTTADLGPTNVFFNSPNPITDFDYFSASQMLRRVAEELNNTDTIREHGLGDLYVNATGMLDITSEEGVTKAELDFFNAHVRVDETDNTIAFYPPWSDAASDRLILGVVGATRQGSALVYDSRTSHRGGRNTRGARVQLMFSFQSKRALISGSTFTMRRRYQRVERLPLTLIQRATMRAFGQEFKTSPKAGAWTLRTGGKIRLRDFPLRPDASDREREWVNEDPVRSTNNERDFDIDGLHLDGADI